MQGLSQYKIYNSPVVGVVIRRLVRIRGDQAEETAWSHGGMLWYGNGGLWWHGMCIGWIT